MSATFEKLAKGTVNDNSYGWQNSMRPIVAWKDMWREAQRQDTLRPSIHECGW